MRQNCRLITLQVDSNKYQQTTEIKKTYGGTEIITNTKALYEDNKNMKALYGDNNKHKSTIWR